MQSVFWKSGACLTVALTMAACSGSPASPTSPTAATAGSQDAAADGSTLKAKEVSLLAPVNGARVESRRPTLSWTESTGLYANFTPDYEVQVSLDGAVVYTVIVSGTSHQVEADADYDRTYTWRVRARVDSSFGPWSATGTFQSPLAGDLVVAGFRTPDPAPGTRLPLPDESALVNDEFNRNYDDWQHSCQEEYGERGWIWLDKLIDRLRTRDLRWGYNGKRGNPNDPSLDVIDYHYGAGDSQFSTQVYIIDVLYSHCGRFPSPGWIDQTAATAAGRTIGRFLYPRPGRVVTP